MTPLKKVAGKVASLRQRVEGNLEAARIGLWARYERVHPPPLDHDFRSHLCRDASALSRLLAANSQAVADADRIGRGRLRAFGFDVDVHDRGFSWHKDVGSGHVYPKVPYPRIPLACDEGHDIIVPWELSRLQFIPTLIQAHRVTGDARYAGCFERIVDRWIAENPFLIGANWVTGMDSAIRAINLGLGLLHFHDHLPTAERYRQVLWAHAEGIHASRDFRLPAHRRHNHFLISAVGLLALSLFFRGKRADRLFKTVMGRLAREALRQFRPDGGNFESAVHYHQISLEALLVAALLLAAKRAAGTSSAAQYRFPEDVEERITRGVTLAADYMRAFGQSPQFGDSSDGRIVIFKDYWDWNPLDHRFLEEMGAVALPERIRPCAAITHRVYPDSGYGFFANDAYGVCLNASRVERAGPAGHHHADKMSIVVQIGGRPVFVDSGTYCYTPDIQARFAHRRTRAHNVVMVDGQDQAQFTAAEVFGRLEGINPVIHYEERGGQPTWTMEHDGYGRLAGVGVVRRVVQCAARRVDIEDHVGGHGEHTVDILFHLHPRVRGEIRGGEVHCRDEDRALCRFEVPPGFSVSVEKGDYSAAYGQREPHDAVVLSRNVPLPWTARYAILVNSH